jgi:hypothetical protein
VIHEYLDLLLWSALPARPGTQRPNIFRLDPLIQFLQYNDQFSVC